MEDREYYQPEVVRTEGDENIERPMSRAQGRSKKHY